MALEEPHVKLAEGEVLTLVTKSGEAHISPQNAAYLARDLLASASTIYASNRPPTGTILGDANLPAFNWAVDVQPDGFPLMRLTVAPDVQLTFRLAPAVARDLGAALSNLVGGASTESTGAAH